MQSNSRNIVLIIVAVLVVGLGAYAAPKITDWFTAPGEDPSLRSQDPGFLAVDTNRLRGGVIVPPRIAPELNLLNQHEEPFSLKDHVGKAVLVFFGYTYCPDVCPLTMYNFTRVKQQLGPLADRVEFVFVTFDPDRDTPERLREYVELFDPSFTALRPDEETLGKLADGYLLSYFAVPNDNPQIGYTFDHTSYIHLIDPTGVLRVVFTSGHTVEQIVDDVRYVIEAYDAQVPPVVIEDAWMRTGFAGGNSAAYLRIRNEGAQPLRLILAESSVARSVEIHETGTEMREVNGQLVEVSTMREVESVEVPARSQVQLQPGGLHIMLIDLNDALRDGEHAPLVLWFDGYPPVHLDVPVRTSPDGEDHDHDHDHMTAH